MGPRHVDDEGMLYMSLERMKKHYLLAFFLLVLLCPYSSPAEDLDLLKKLHFVPQAGSVPAPFFTAENLEGKKMSLDDFRGKVVILNFWATWCPPCRLEMPSMEKLYRRFKGQGLEIVAMNFMERPEPISSFMKDNALTFRVLLDRTGEIAQLYGAHALPVSYLIGREGDLLAKSIGYKDWYKKEVRQFASLLLEDESTIRTVTTAVEVESRKVSTGYRWWRYFVLGLALIVFFLVYNRRASKVGLRQS
jgi:thiol-disulfide isomerase/thioredoxin